MDIQRRHEIINTREKRWYPEPQREALLTQLRLLSTDPHRHRLRSVAIIGEGNSGKSAVVERYLLKHPPTRGDEAMEIPAIYIDMSGVQQVQDLSRHLLEAIGAPDPSAGTHDHRLKRFVQLAPQVRLGLVFLDEFHEAANSKGKGQPFLRCIKFLMNAGVLVVPIGTHDVAAVLERDTQLSSRFNFSRGRLARVTNLAVVKALMGMVTDVPADTVTDAAAQYVLDETHGVLGHILDLTEDTYLLRGDLRLNSLRAERKAMDALNKVV